MYTYGPNQTIITWGCDDGEILCIFLPPNTTSVLQPMDQGVLEALKRHYKHDLLLCMLNEERVGSMNIAEFIKTINIKDAVLMSARSWDEVKEPTIAKSWKKLLSSSASPQQEVESDASQQGPEYTNMQSTLDTLNIPSAERVDWLNSDNNVPGYHDYSEEEIVALLREEGENNFNEDDEETAPTASHAQACQAFETVLVYLEQQPHVPMNATVLINGLYMKAVKKRYETQKQTKTSDYFTCTANMTDT